MLIGAKSHSDPEPLPERVVRRPLRSGSGQWPTALELTVSATLLTFKWVLVRLPPPAAECGTADIAGASSATSHPPESHPSREADGVHRPR